MVTTDGDRDRSCPMLGRLEARGFGTAAQVMACALVRLLHNTATTAFFIWVLAGGVLYLLVTMAGNVPLNDRLASADPAEPAAAEEWWRYESRWTAWNHVRGFTSLGAAALLTIALVD